MDKEMRGLLPVCRSRISQALCSNEKNHNNNECAGIGDFF